MPLDYSQKQLLSTALKGGAGHGTFTRMKKHGLSFSEKLPAYAFWTGFLSTIISLVQVIIIASK